MDGYTGYNRVLDPKTNGDIQLAYCWAHARRKLFELTKNSTAQIANDGLKQITALYRIESQIRGRPVDERLAVRKESYAQKVVTARSGGMVKCSIPDDHIAPRRAAFFVARSVLSEVRDGRTTC